MYQTIRNSGLFKTKQVCLVFSICFLFQILSFSANAQTSKNIVLVIDAGHGGKDPGNLAQQTSMLDEKHINLKIAKLFGHYVDSMLSDVKILYTRTDDSYTSPQERADFANNNNADYYISLHCNYNEDKTIYGSEFHIHKTDFKTSYNLARRIERDFVKRVKRKSRGVKSYADRDNMHILVVRDTRMPAVLVEMGFMSNPEEEEFLNSETGQDYLASALYRAFRDFSGATKKTDPQIIPSTTIEPECTKVYRVQIVASKTKLKTTSEPFRKLTYQVEEQINEKTETYRYKYYVGKECKFEDAKKVKTTVAKQGFPDAFIVGPYNR